MSLAQLYSAMVEQVTGLGAERNRRPIGQDFVRIRTAQPDTMLVQEAQRIRDLERENAEIKARFTTIVNLLLNKGVIARGEIESFSKMQVQVSPVSTEPTIQPVSKLKNALPTQNKGSGKRRKKGRR